MTETLSFRLEQIRASIAKAHMASPLSATMPQLVAVSKGHPLCAVEEAYKAGQRHFGENKVQEAEEKFTALKKLYKDVVLHGIGHLQSNKAKNAVALFDVIHSLDRPSLADALAAEMVRQGRQVPCFVQVNIGEEPQKGGVMPQDLAQFLAYCRERNLPVTGLMCIPPAQKNAAHFFGLLHHLAKGAGVNVLSMGMSGDYEQAIRFGATHIRIGTAIFGERA